MKLEIVAFLFVAILVVLFSGARTRSQHGQPKLRRIDINGTWTNDKGEEIVVSQTAFNVSAKFAKAGPNCDLQGKNRTRPLYLSALIKGRGLYEGSTLEGDMGGCTRVAKLIQDCSFDVAYIVRFKADKVSLNQISGQYTPDYVNYDTQNGKWVNCSIKKGGGTPVNFSLTRKCDPDKGALCETIGNALRDMKAAQTQTPSTQFYQHLQMKLGDQIAKMRANLCNNAAGEAKLGEIEDYLDSLNYAPGQANLQNNVTMGYIETGLHDLTRIACAVGPPVDYGTCPEGTRQMTDDDSKLLKSFEPELINMLRTSATNIIAYDETKKCLSKMFTGGCMSDNFAKGLTAAAQAHQQGMPFMEVCDQACASLGAWYEQAGCPEGLKKETVIAKCKLACMNPDWGQ